MLILNEKKIVFSCPLKKESEKVEHLVKAAFSISQKDYH